MLLHIGTLAAYFNYIFLYNTFKCIQSELTLHSGVHTEIETQKTVDA